MDPISVTASPSSPVVGIPKFRITADTTNITANQATPIRIVANDHTVELTKGENWTSLYVGKDQYVYNKVGAFPLGTAPIIKEDGNMYVPVSFFEKVLQASYITESGVVTIKQ